MNYYGAMEIAASFRTVRKNTIAIAEDIPEERFGFTPVFEVRSVAQLLMHLVLAPTFQRQIHEVERRTTLEGFDFPALMQRLNAEINQPHTKAQILELLRREGEHWATWVEGLSDDCLAESVQMPPGATPPDKSRFEMIISVKEHEMHHRGQLMLIERLLGIIPHLTRERMQRS